MKWRYLAYFGLKWKTKATSFSQTFKVEENKVSLFFWFGLKWASYDHFFILYLFNRENSIFKRRRVAYIDGVVGRSVGWSVGLQNILKILEISVVRVFMPLEVALVGHFVCMTRRRIRWRKRSRRGRTRRGRRRRGRRRRKGRRRGSSSMSCSSRTVRGRWRRKRRKRRWRIRGWRRRRKGRRRRGRSCINLGM